MRRLSILATLVGLVGPFAVGAKAQNCDSGIKFDGPIRIESGGVYTGNWQSTDATIPAVMIVTDQPVTIVNSRAKGPGDLINASVGPSGGINLTVQQSCFVGTNPNVYGQGKGTPIHVYKAISVLVDHCDFEAGGNYGIWVQEYVGDHTANNTIRILNNRIHNVDGRFSDGKDGYLTTQSSQYSHGIILSNVHGVTGIEIAWNQIINEPYQCGVGDSINIFDASGTEASPMQIHDNYIQGGWDSDPANGDGLAYFGSAFTTDGLFQTDPNLTTSFLKIHDNQAVGFGNLGMSISLGHDNEMYSNRVVSSGQLAAGTNSSTSYAIGIQHIDYRDNPPGVFGNNSIHDNLSGLRRQRNGTWERFDYWFGVPPIVDANNAQWQPATAEAPTFADEASEWLAWKGKLSRQGISIGSALVRAPTPNYFAQVAIGGGFTTIFTLLNTGAAAVTGNLILTGDQGTPLYATFSSPNGGGGLSSSFQFSVPSGGSQSVTADPTNPGDPTSMGWARVDTTGGSLGGVATFQLANSKGALTMLVGVLSDATTNAATVPIGDDLTLGAQSRSTGYAIANTGTTNINVKIVLVNPDGTVFQTIIPAGLNPLPPGNHIARFVWQDVSPSFVFQGSAVLIETAAQPFSVVALVFNQGLYSAIPVIPGKASGVQ